MNRASVEVDADESVICDSKEICSSQVIHLDFEDGKNYSHEQTVTAEEGKEITVILDYSSLPEAGGFSTIKTKLIAKPYSKIHLVKVQLLGSNFVQIDETYGECDDNAQIEVTQIELGGSKVFAQVKNELKGYKSKFNSSTAYITKDNQVLDLNYVSNHTGAATETKMLVKGVVDGKSSKLTVVQSILRMAVPVRWATNRKKFLSFPLLQLTSPCRQFSAMKKMFQELTVQL